MKRAHALSRRERQIMDILYRAGKATAAEVREAMPDAPSYSAVRAMLRILEEKGHLSHEQDGPRYVFLPAEPRDQAKRSALRHLVETFFDGSVEQTVAALLDTESKSLQPSELEKLSRIIEEARKKGV
ncbi:MAG: BlaI/MecI/CopY family transcriptional regulator [Acidobacteria bacterium]|jgi:predicted transcriptional regulator|nr:BlaI/MecI/CopY family transcriptional regulator [Acidobacteriota bacterium]